MWINLKTKYPQSANGRGMLPVPLDQSIYLQGVQFNNDHVHSSNAIVVDLREMPLTFFYEGEIRR